MTEPTPQAEATETTAARRGRPRPQTTIDRDKQVLDALAGETKTREQLVEATGLTKNQVYLSLWRLRKDGLAERTRDGGKHVWAQTAPAA